jgi:hypothetical protein
MDVKVVKSSRGSSSFICVNLRPSAVEKISKIKAAFVKAIGEELAKHYYIHGGNGEVKKVSLDRELFTFEF